MLVYPTPSPQRNRRTIRLRTFPGRKTSTVGGKWYLHESGGYSSMVLVSGNRISLWTGISDSTRGIRANDARVDGSSPSPGTVSRGRLTTIFFCFCGGGAGAAAAAGVGGIGLTFLWGPPSTALGGPPTLMLADRLLLGTKGGGNGVSPGTICCGKPCPMGVIGIGPRGVMGIPGGGRKPAAASCMTLG